MKLQARLVLVLTLVASTVAAQTKVTPPKNKYTPEQDVKIGREAAAEVRREYPLIDDSQIRSYLDRTGDRLVDGSPADLKKPVFEYSFTPVNLKDINAFALPGGPMFVNRGMIEAASQEAEVAGVMAHELAHVLLRHGTANATKAQGFQIGALAGAIAGAVIGGGLGEVISQGSQFGLGTYFLKYSREYEKQADLLGAQIMARAGYDPRALARMFEIYPETGRGESAPVVEQPPEPRQPHAVHQCGSRSTAYCAAVRRLRLPTGQEPLRVVAAGPLDGGPRAKCEGERRRQRAAASVGTVGQPVPAPSRQYRTVRGGDLFQVSAPTNWTPLSSNNAMKLVPQNGYGQAGGQETMTHGAELGVARASSRDLRQATQTLVEGFLRSNPGMRITGAQRTMQLAGRNAIVTPLEGRSAVGGTERVDLQTTLLSDGNLFYYLTVVPEREYDTYSTAFDRVARSIRLNDR